MGWNQMNQAKRIFMNEVDSGSGNGAQVASATPAEPTAAPTAPVLDVDALMSRLSGVIDEKLSAHQNAINAGLRRANVFKQDKPTGEPASAQPTQSAPVAAQAGAVDFDARIDARLELERVIASREAKYGLSESQSKRLRSSLSGVARESLAAEADSYLSDLGLAKAAPATTPAPAAPAAAAQPNISDRGAAAPTDTRDSNGVLNSRPLEMTGHDVDALMLKEGYDQGLQTFQAHVLRALSNVRIKPPRG
jgi:hypothetical protein